MCLMQVVCVNVCDSWYIFMCPQSVCGMYGVIVYRCVVYIESVCWFVYMCLVCLRAHVFDAFGIYAHL